MFFVQKDMVNSKTYTMSNSNNSAFASSASGTLQLYLLYLLILGGN